MEFKMPNITNCQRWRSLPLTKRKEKKKRQSNRCCCFCRSHVRGGDPLQSQFSTLNLAALHSKGRHGLQPGHKAQARATGQTSLGSCSQHISHGRLHVHMQSSPPPPRPFDTSRAWGAESTFFITPRLHHLRSLCRGGSHVMSAPSRVTALGQPRQVRHASNDDRFVCNTRSSYYSTVSKSWPSRCASARMCLFRRFVVVIPLRETVLP